ncbi:hypothetical protein EBU99_11755 [bacterium]|nr:hypothetical protein [bacterium]
MITNYANIGYQGLFDTSLLGLLLGPGEAEAELRCVANSQLVAAEKLGRGPLLALDAGGIDLAVVTLEELFQHVLDFPQTTARVIGGLVDGDCRALVSLMPAPDSLKKRVLGATHAKSALSRWEDISCGLDLDWVEDSAEEVPPQDRLSALLNGHYSLMEVNLFWEGVIGIRRGLISQIARAHEFGVPKSYSHVLVAREDFIKSHPQQLKDFRDFLLKKYELILKNPEDFSTQLARAEVFSCRPDPGFVLASLRILAPHLESFLQTRGAIALSDILPFLRWYQSRIASDVPAAQSWEFPIAVENMFSDVWL